MKIKTCIISTCLLLLGIATLSANNEDIKPVKSKLTQATVFLRGAELTHTATVSLKKDDNEIRIEGLSPSIDQNSLKIKANNGVVISSSEFSVDNLVIKSPNNSRIKAINDSIESCKEEISKIQAELNVDKRLAGLMETGVNKNIADTIKIAELMKVMEYYQNKATELEMRKIENSKKLRNLETLVSELQSRLSQVSSYEYERSGILRLTTSAPLATSCTFTISYYTPLAQWVPYYDINIKSTDRPIDIVAKAKVSQTTTVDWSRVKLTLSTSVPGNGKQAPLFRTWFLQYIRHAVVNNNWSMAQNSVSYNTEKSLDEVVVVGYGTKKKETLTTTPNINPVYVVNGSIVNENYYNSLNPSSIKNVSYMNSEDAIAQYGTAASGGAVVVELKDDITDFVSEEEDEMNLTFNIDIPYSIPGNGKEQSITLQTKQTSADYKYYCAPKLDRETFLIAELSGWEKLNLLSGKANVTYNQTYVGETFINATSTSEKLPLTLGTDKRVNVKRELMKESSNKKTFGSNIKQVFTYKITVKNNQNKPIHMVLKEQYPLSTTKELKTELLIKETTTPTVNREDLGVITWEEDFKPGESKTYQISYSIEYPKDKEGQVNIQ